MDESGTHVTARVRHEPDRTYTVVIDGPDGAVDVGRTDRTADLWALARAGAVRLFGDDSAPDDLVLHVPRPPYGRDGQWVRTIGAVDPDDPSEAADVGALAQAHWSSHDGAWFVTTADSGTGIVAGEFLDFEPVVTDEEATAFRATVAVSPDR